MILDKTFSENASAAYVLQSGFILFYYDQFIFFLGTKTTKIRLCLFPKQYSKKYLGTAHSLSHMFFMFLKEKKKKKIKKNIPQKLVFFVLPVAEICSTKICTREYYALMVFGISNEYALNPQGIFNLYSLYFYLRKN